MRHRAVRFCGIGLQNSFRFIKRGGQAGGMEEEGKYLGEFLEAPFVVFAWIVAGEVCGCDICNCLAVDAYDLCRISL